MSDHYENRRALIGLVRELSAHGLYPVDSMRAWLTDCGFSAETRNNQIELLVFGRVITRVTGDWGDGICPRHVLEAAVCFYKLEDTIRSEMIGRGFMYNDLVDQFEKAIVFNREHN